MHPTVQVFVEIIKQVCQEYVDLMKIIKLRQERKQNHASVPVPEIPADFKTFKF